MQDIENDNMQKDNLLGREARKLVSVIVEANTHRALCLPLQSYFL